VRLAAARSLAWALWLGGWLLIGEFGHRHWLLWFGGMLPLSLWLLAIGALLQVSRPLSAPVLASGLGIAALLVVWGLAATATTPLVIGWAMLVVAASRVVRSLRHGRPRTAPLAPACAGALLALALANEGSWVLMVALLLALLMPWRGTTATGCRSGLFDCALPVAALAPWREAARWPQPAAQLAMLPMMAGLPWLAEACAAVGWWPRTESALHLAAMLLPPLLLQAPLRRLPERPRQAGIALLLLAGGIALWLMPGVRGLMASMLLHGAAWSLAWGGVMASGQRQPTGPAPWATSAFGALLLLALGAALSGLGLGALAGVHALLAGCGAVGMAGVWLEPSRTAQAAAGCSRDIP
jgi:hypothetical protein